MDVTGACEMKINRGGKQKERLQDNALRESFGKTQLRCGHEVGGVPVAVFPGRRMMYRCPECGLQEPKRRS